MATIPNRIKAFAETIGASIRQVEIKTGASNGTFSKAIAQDRDIGSHWIEKIVNAYPDLNAYWLVTGMGDMLKQLSDINKEMQPTYKALQETSEAIYGKNAHLIAHPNAHLKGKKGKEITTVADEEHVEYGGRTRAIPILDARAAAGWPYTIDHSGFLGSQPTLSLPPPWFSHGQYVLIQIEGDSMHPTIYHGDWVFIRKIEEVSEIKDGYVHVVLTRDGIVCKRLLNRVTKGHIALQSDNSAYPTYTVPVDEVLSIWRVEMKMSAILRNENLDIVKRLSTLEADIAEIKAKKKG